jgi:AraC-like DNA-binding protein
MPVEQTTKGHRSGESSAQPARNEMPQKTTSRNIVARPGVGAAGRIIQRVQLTSHRVMVDAPTLIFVQRGQKCIRWSEGECVANAGDAIAIDAGQIIDITNTPGPDQTYGAQWITWTPDAVNAFSQTITAVRPFTVATLVSTIGDGFCAAYQAAFESLSEVDGIPILVANHRLTEVLLWLHVRGVNFMPSRKETFTMRVRQLISGNPAHQWTIETVARDQRSSQATLRRRLAAENQSFRGLLNDVRMSHALALLQNTDSPILDIASTVGYDSASRFAGRFRSRFGYLPSELRGQNRGIPRTSARSLSDSRDLDLAVTSK